MPQSLIGNKHSVLVTGGAGFIGSHFIEQLLHSPFEGSCVNIDSLTYAGSESLAKAFTPDSRYTFYRGDICDIELLEKVIKTHEIDLIVHFAAETHVDRSIESPAPFIHSNIQGTFSLLEAVRKFPQIHFHHISTDEVYGSLGEAGLFTEESPLRPNSPYSSSKASSDLLVIAYAKTFGISTTISRCSNNFGPNQHPEKLIPKVIDCCRHRLPIPIYGRGNNIRDWIYVGDHITGVFQIIREGEIGEIYNLGASNEWNNLQLVEALLEQFALETQTPLDELKALIRFVDDRPGHDFRYALCCDKAQRELGWHPRCEFQETLRTTVRHSLLHVDQPLSAVREERIQTQKTALMLNLIHPRRLS